jgi:hypothetical protein
VVLAGGGFERLALGFVGDVQQQPVVGPTQFLPMGKNRIFAGEAEAAVEEDVVGAERLGQLGNDPRPVVGTRPEKQNVRVDQRTGGVVGFEMGAIGTRLARDEGGADSGDEGRKSLGRGDERAFGHRKAGCDC